MSEHYWIHVGEENGMRKASFLVLTVILLNTALIASPIMPSSAVTTLPETLVYASSYTISGNINDTVSIDINISNVQELFAGQASLVFDPSKVNCFNITQGEFLKRAGQETVLFTYFNSTNGIAAAGVQILGLYSVSGSGQLVTFKFKIISPGSSGVHLREVLLISPRDVTVLIPTRIKDVYYASYGDSQ